MHQKSFLVKSRIFFSTVYDLCILSVRTSNTSYAYVNPFCTQRNVQNTSASVLSSDNVTAQNRVLTSVRQVTQHIFLEVHSKRSNCALHMHTKNFSGR